MYEWAQRWPPASFLAFLARISTQRTLGEHLQRVAFAPVLHHASQTGVSSSSSSFGGVATTSSVGAAAALSTVQRELQNDFMEQLLFMVKKHWVRQVSRYVVRVDEDEEEEDETEEESDEESDARAMRRSHPSTPIAATPLVICGSSDAASADPWRALLDRLTPRYFDGRHSVTEMLWRERETGLTLAHLQHLCTLFPRQLFIMQHM